MPTLPRVDAACASCLDLGNPAETLSDVLSQFLTSIIDLAGAQGGAVRVLDDDDRTLQLVACQGMPAELVALEQGVDSHCGFCGQASQADSLLWIEDLQACAQHAGGLFFGTACRAMLIISLPHSGQILGVYNLFFDQPTRPAAPVLTVLRLIGQILGLTLHSARIERERLRLTVLNERQEMVHEVHDVLAQTLAYARMRIPLLEDAIGHQDRVKAQNYLSDLSTAITQVHNNLREVMDYFHTRMDPLGLLHALGKLADGFQAKHGIALTLDIRARGMQLSESQETQIYYIIQEALANIAKHSMARHARIRIDRDAQDWLFCIEDDGLGMDDPCVSTIVTSAQPTPGTQHLGLGIMQSRAKRLRAQLAFQSADGLGTQVLLRVPCNATTLGPSP